MGRTNTTIILDTESGKLFSIYWDEEDNYVRAKRREITLEQAKELCQKCHEAIRVAPLRTINLETA